MLSNDTIVRMKKEKKNLNKVRVENSGSTLGGGVGSAEAVEHVNASRVGRHHHTFLPPEGTTPFTF